MNKGILYCSFCGKSQHEVVKLIAGPQVAICDECVQLCVDIINEVTAADLEYASWFVPQDSKVRSDSALAKKE